MNEQAPPLTGKIALVTGASRGIGRAIAQRFASAGATVVVTARSLDKSIDFNGTLNETVALIEQSGGKAIPMAADLTVAEQRDALVKRTLEATGRLDILVNNAGLAEYARVEDMSDEVFENTIDHYLRAPFKLSQAAIAPMKAQGAGWIINLGSLTAQRPFKPFDDYARLGGSTVYAAIKAGVARFTQGLAAELEADNIAVNMVAPSGAIRTPGASRYIPEDYPAEPVEYLAETALALCLLPAAERTGLLAHSMHFPRAMNLTVRNLDGTGTLPAPEIDPAFDHPGVMALGE